MPRDLPDWGALTAQKTVYEITDLGELAARLGSPVTFNRRGDVVFIDSFEDGLRAWYLSPAGTGSDIYLSTQCARSGMFSARLIGGSDGDHQAAVLHRCHYPVLSSFGIEASFLVPGEIESFGLEFYVYDGVEVSIAAVEWVAASKEVKYWDADGADATLASGLDLALESYLFHTLKMVVDFENDQYRRCLLDNRSWDMSDIPLYASAVGSAQLLLVWVYIRSREGENDDAYVDDIILTQNEP